MPKLSHIDVARSNPDFGRIIADSLGDTLVATGNEIIPKGSFCGRHFTMIHQVAAQAESPIPEQQWLILICNQREAVRSSKIEKAINSIYDENHTISY